MLLAILFPSLSFFFRGKILTGILCIFLQFTIIGWIPAAFWAVSSLNSERADKRVDRLIRGMKNQ